MISACASFPMCSSLRKLPSTFSRPWSTANIRVNKLGQLAHPITLRCTSNEQRCSITGGAGHHSRYTRVLPCDRTQWNVCCVKARSTLVYASSRNSPNRARPSAVGCTAAAIAMPGRPAGPASYGITTRAERSCSTSCAASPQGLAAAVTLAVAIGRAIAYLLPRRYSWAVRDLRNAAATSEARSSHLGAHCYAGFCCKPPAIWRRNCALSCYLVMACTQCKLQLQAPACARGTHRHHCSAVHQLTGARQHDTDSVSLQM
jgi:hypothetical protein